MNLTIGSGDVSALMAGINTKTFGDLMRKFVDEDKPYYNALASPIDALRTGAILEQNYLKLLSDDYFIQYKATNEEMDVFTSSLDFAKINGGKIVDFDEMKTINFSDYISLIHPMIGLDEKEQKQFLLKNFKKNYYQVQIQLFCSKLESANIVFVAVDSYVDEENLFREIQENEYAKFRIYRDENIIDQITKKGQIFQTIKNYFNTVK
jgi:hypothetical protein